MAKLVLCPLPEIESRPTCSRCLQCASAWRLMVHVCLPQDYEIECPDTKTKFSLKTGEITDWWGTASPCEAPHACLGLNACCDLAAPWQHCYTAKPHHHHGRYCTNAAPSRMPLGRRIQVKAKLASGMRLHSRQCTRRTIQGSGSDISPRLLEEM